MEESSTNNPITTKICPFCAETIQAAAIVCRYCNRDLETTPKVLPTESTIKLDAPLSQAVDQRVADKDEVTYLSNGDVLITNSRAVIGGKTYAMANVTSVVKATETTEGCGCTGILFGLIILIPSIWLLFIGINSGIAIVLGVGIALVGEMLRRASKPKYYVRIGSASAESNILTSFDEHYIQEIVDAMNKAIVNRG